MERKGNGVIKGKGREKRDRMTPNDLEEKEGV